MFVEPPDQHTLSPQNNRGPGLAPLTCLFVTRCTCCRKNSGSHTPGTGWWGTGQWSPTGPAAWLHGPACREARTPVPPPVWEQSWQLTRTVAFRVHNCWRQVTYYCLHKQGMVYLVHLCSPWFPDLTFTELPHHLRPGNTGECTLVKRFWKL